MNEQDKQSNEKLRGAVIGFGRMGMTHYSILNTRDDVDFVAVSDPSVLVRKGASRYLGVKTYADYEEMLGDLELDFVIIAAPTSLHKQSTLRALSRGLHVFLEKPFTLGPPETQEVLAAAEKARVVAQIGYVLRFNAVMKKAHEVLASGILGELFDFQVEMVGPTVLQGAKSSWRSAKSQGGGCLYDFASHAVDLINYMLGKPDSVSGTVMKSIYSEGVEDAVYSTLHYESGLSGRLISNWSDASVRKPSYRLSFSGTNGKLVADLHAYKLFVRKAPPDNGAMEGWSTNYITDFDTPVRFYLRGNEFTRQLDHFIDSIHAKAAPQTNGFKDAAATDQTMAMIRDDA